MGGARKLQGGKKSLTINWSVLLERISAFCRVLDTLPVLSYRVLNLFFCQRFFLRSGGIIKRMPSLGWLLPYPFYYLLFAVKVSWNRTQSDMQATCTKPFVQKERSQLLDLREKRTN